MSAFRSAIRAVLALSIFTIASLAQEGQVAGTFRLAPGTSFSASSRTPDRKAKLPPPLKSVADDFGEALEIVGANHAAGKRNDPERVFSSAVDGMLRALDPHSNYYTPNEFKGLNDDHRGRYVGIGTSISDFRQNGQNGVYVLEVKNGSPAREAGLRFGDRIRRVDGKNVGDLDSTAVRDLLRGADGSSVNLTIERLGVNGLLELRARRTALPEPSIPAAFIAVDSIGYIALTEGFKYTTVSEFDDAYRKLRAQGMTSLIVDLRGNGGGLMEQAIRIAEKFLPSGRAIVSQHGRRPSEERTWISSNRRPETLPMVLLVDENTASASEIFAAAMQDNDRATIVGSRTFGKGLVQDVIPLANGAGLVLTSERYYAPSGRSIQRDYSDIGLYDYFRHINKSSLIDRPSFAARTANGRIVYGGDGIAPDVQIGMPSWTSEELRAYEAAFFIAREGAASPDGPNNANIERNLKWFKSLAIEGAASASKTALENDPQMRAAISSLAVKPSNSK